MHDVEKVILARWTTRAYFGYRRTCRILPKKHFFTMPPPHSAFVFLLPPYTYMVSVQPTSSQLHNPSSLWPKIHSGVFVCTVTVITIFVTHRPTSSIIGDCDIKSWLQYAWIMRSSLYNTTSSMPYRYISEDTKECLVKMQRELGTNWTSEVMEVHPTTIRRAARNKNRTGCTVQKTCEQGCPRALSGVEAFVRYTPVLLYWKCS